MSRKSLYSLFASLVVFAMVLSGCGGTPEATVAPTAEALPQKSLLVRLAPSGLLSGSKHLLRRSIARSHRRSRFRGPQYAGLPYGARRLSLCHRAIP